MVMKLPEYAPPPTNVSWWEGGTTTGEIEVQARWKAFAVSQANSCWNTSALTSPAELQ